MGFCTFHTLMKTHSGKIEMQIIDECIVNMNRSFTSNGLKRIQTNIHMDFNSFLENKIKASKKINDQDTIEQAERKDKELVKKVEKYRLNELTEEERSIKTVDVILQSIITDIITRSIFRKDPTKQSIHEKAQIEWIQMKKYSDAIKIPADGNGTCLSNNNLHIITKNSPRPPDATKTLDVHIPSKNIYATLKYTNESGGSQDNQFRDVKHFIVQAVGYLSHNESAIENFAFYLDGAYYKPSKMKELNDMVPENIKERILITSCASL